MLKPVEGRTSSSRGGTAAAAIHKQDRRFASGLIRFARNDASAATMRLANLAAPVLLTAVILAGPATAREFYVGGPVHKHDMEIVANYLVGIEMAPMTADMVHGADVIHIECDVHATADNVYGYPDGAWIGYLTIRYTIEKTGSGWKASGTLKPMTAKDGPHYAENVKVDGPGEYKLTYRFEPPVTNGFLRHTDKETGVPGWWAPFDETFTFKYPQAE